GDRIVDMGHGLDGDIAVDCTGKTLVPGFIDAHVHLAVSGVPAWEQLETPFSLQFFQTVVNMQKTLSAGVTTVRDAAAADLGAKVAVDRGLVPGPRVQISIAMINQTGGHAEKWMCCGGVLPLPYTMAHPGRPQGSVDGVDAVRRRVRELV